jgi:hypothetical protein
LTLNIAPGKIIALFPANTVSGKLHKPKQRWTELFGASRGALLYPGYGSDALDQESEEEKSGLIKNVVGLMGGHTLGRKASAETLPTKESSEVESGEPVPASPVDKTVEDSE